MDGNYYPWLYPERELDEFPPTYPEIASASRGRDDLQGITGPLPMSLSFPDRLSSSMPDRIASTPHQRQFLMAPNNNDSITQDLRLSPAQPSLGYPKTEHGYEFDCRTDLLPNPGTHQDAWNPLRVTGVSHVSMPDASQEIPKRRRINGSDSGTVHQSEGASSDVGSQCYTEQPQSDSAYGTKSVATASVIDSFHTDDALFIPSRRLRAGSQNPISFSGINFEPSGKSPGPISHAGSDVLPHQENGSFKCGLGNCRWVGKNLSDKRKHETRHLKPFTCDQEGCKRGKEGFGTKNDLGRHRKSVHGLESENGGTGKFYKCFAENCVRKEKEWPRLDNFRQHLVRMHGEASLNDLLRKSDMWFNNKKRACLPSPKLSTSRPHQPLLPTMGARSPLPQDPVSSAPSLGPWAQDNIKADGESVMPTDLTKSPNNAVRELELTPIESSRDNPHDDTASFTTENSPMSDSRGRVKGQTNTYKETNARFQRPSSTNSPRNQPSSREYPFRFSLPRDSWDDHPTRTAVALINDLKKQIDAWDERKRCREEERLCSASTAATDGTSELSRDIQNKNDELQRLLLDGLGNLGFHPPDVDPSNSERSTFQSNGKHSDQSRKFQCPVCQKKLDQRCKLTKHMKRHNRPYECTLPNCPSKPFGSKNDWKRHENSQHFQLQCWRCHIESDVYPFAECNRLFYRREKFIHHLDRQHGVRQEHEISTYLKTDEIGRNRQSRFWCGFCRKIIALRHRGMDAWNERFNHIDEQHFSKGERMKSWQHPEIHRSDSPTVDDYERNRKAEHIPDGEEEVDANNGSSNDTDTDESSSEGDERISEKPSTLPVIRVSEEPSTNNDTSTETRQKSPRPRLRLDTSSPNSLIPQTQKRKFASASLPATGITQSHGRSQKHRHSDQLAPNRRDNPQSAFSYAGSANPYQEHNTLRPTARSATCTTTAAALFSTTPQEKMRKTLPTDIFSCCHCSGVVVMSLSDTCSICGHPVCVFCNKGQSPNESPSR